MTKKDATEKKVPQANVNTLGIEGLSTQPSGSGKRSSAELPIEFGRYRLLKLLGQGGMGAVYLAHDSELDRQVALKLPHFADIDRRDLSERFRREARLAATLNHPNICRIFDISENENRLFLTMEFVEGKSLNEIIKAKGAIEPRTATKLVSKIAAAVHFAHAKGIIHRDLKPANIMIKKDRDFVIMDFGLARRVEQEDVQLTATGAVLGTPAYMAPEQLRGENKAVGPQSDVYSLGIILYELLTGQRPFQGTLPQIYAQVLSADSVSPSSIQTSIEADLDAICRQATAANVNNRYRTAEEFAKALAGYLTMQSQTSFESFIPAPALVAVKAPLANSQYTVKKPTSSARSFAKPIAIGGIVGLAALVLAGVVLLRQPNSQLVKVSPVKVEEIPVRSDSNFPVLTAPVVPESPTVAVSIPPSSPPASVETSTLSKESSLDGTNATLSAAIAQVQVSGASLPAVAADAQPPGLVWSVPPSKVWWRCASYSPKGNFVAASGEDRENSNAEFATIRVWPIREDQKGNDSFVLLHPASKSWVSAMSFSPDGRRLASATLNGSIALWDMEATAPNLLTSFQRFDEKIIGLAFSPDGRYFAGGARKAGVPVVVWDLANVRQPKEVFRCTLPNPDEACSFVFSRDSKSLFIGSGLRGSDGHVFKWLFETERDAKLLWSAPSALDTHWVRSLDISRDSSKLAIAFGSNAFVVDPSDGREIKKLAGHAKEIQAIQLSSNADALLTGSVDQTLRLWSVATGNETWRNEVLTGPNEGVALSPDDQFAFSSSRGSSLDPLGYVQFWRLPEANLHQQPPTSHQVTTTQEQSSAISFSVEAENALPPGLVWSSPAGKTRWWSACFSPTGKFVAAGEQDPAIQQPQNAMIRVWPLSSEQNGSDSIVLRHPTANTRISSLVFSNDGKLMASGTGNGSIALWDMETTSPTLLTTFQRFDATVFGLAFSPDGRYFASGSAKTNTPVLVWDIGNPMQPKEAFKMTLPAPDSPCAFDFSNDSKTLYISAGAKDQEGHLFAWTFRTDKNAKQLWTGPAQSNAPFPRSIKLSPDGNQIAIAHGTQCHVIQAISGKPIGSFIGHAILIQAIAWSPDGTACYSAGYDQTIRKWRVADSTELWRNEAATGRNEGFGVSADGKFGFSSGYDMKDDTRNVVQFWRLPIGAKFTPIVSDGNVTRSRSNGDTNPTANDKHGVSVKGNLKRVNIAERFITVVRATPQGEKELQVEVAKEAGDISALAIGDELEFLYDPQLEMLLKFNSLKFTSDAKGIDALQGEWVASHIDRYGNKEYSPEQVKAENRRYRFNGTEWQWTMSDGGKPFETRGAVRINSMRGTIDLIEVTASGYLITFVGIYECTPTTLSVCLRRKWFADQSSDDQRPKNMKSESTKPQTEHFQFQKSTAK